MIERVRVAQGAEAIPWKNENLKKERVSKGYRHPEIDSEIRKRRTKAEARLLERASRAGVNVPRVINVSDFEIEMEFVEGKRVKDVIAGASAEERKKLGEKIGESISLLHSNNIIHGDLTTSNMILKDEKVFFIDFGLGEKMAVDLRLLKEVFTSTHYKYYEMFEEILKAYKWEKSTEVIERMKVVESRGRYVKR